MKLLPFNKSSLMKNDFINLEKNEQRKQFDREKQKEDIFNQIQQIRYDIAQFQDKLQSYEKTPVFLQKIQEASEALERRLEDFQNQQMIIFDQITQEEDALEHDLELFESRIESYQAPVSQMTNGKKGLGKQTSTKTAGLNEFEEIDEEDDRDQNEFLRKQQFGDEFTQDENNYSDWPNEGKTAFGNKDDPCFGNKDIEKIEIQLQKTKLKIDDLQQKIIQNGGKNCGWDNADHSDFLQIKVQHKGQMNRQAFLNDILLVVPIYTQDDIKEHIQQFNIYTEYDTLQKSLLQNYKELKDKKQNQVIQVIAEAQDKQKKQQEDKGKKSQQQELKEKEKLKEDLQQWKMRRTVAQQIEIETKVVEEKEKLREKLQLEKQKKQEKKKMINQYKDQKLYEQMREQQLKEYQKNITRRVVTSQERDRIKAKEDMLLKQKQAVLLKQNIEQQDQYIRKLKLQENSKIKFSHVEPKLLQVTTAAEMHRRDKFDPQLNEGRGGRIADTFGGNLLGMGARAVPQWRQGLA